MIKNISQKAKNKERYPEDWKVLKISDVADVKGGKRLPKGYSLQEKPNGYPYITVSDMYIGGISTENIKYVPEEVVDKIKNYRISTDDLFISVAGTLGIVGKVPESLNNANLTENADKLTNIKIDKEYLYQVLISDIIQKEIEKEKTTNAQPKLALTRIKNFRIPVPSNRNEIKKIALILSTWDKAIELKEKLIEQKKELKKGLMQKLLTGEVRLPGFEGKWKKVKLKEISVCLDNLRKPINSKEREKMKGNIPYYGANGIVDYVNDYLFDEPLILMAEDGGHFNEFRHRPIAMKIEGKTWVNNHAHVLRIINSDHDFVYYSLVHKDIRKYINGSTRGKLTQSDMLAIELILPDSIEEQKAISHILMKIDLNIELLEKELKELKYQKKGLMQLLLTGKVRVKV